MDCKDSFPASFPGFRCMDKKILLHRPIPKLLCILLWSIVKNRFLFLCRERVHIPHSSCDYPCRLAASIGTFQDCEMTGDSKWPFYPLFGGRLTFEGSLNHPKKGKENCQVHSQCEIKKTHWIHQFLLMAGRISSFPLHKSMWQWWCFHVWWHKMLESFFPKSSRNTLQLLVKFGIFCSYSPMQ